MKHFIRTFLSTALIAAALAACQNQTPTFAPQINAQNIQAQARRPQASKPRSDEVLDAVAIRARFIMFQSMDTNRDGVITARELMYGYDPNQIFSKIDTDKDGRINLSEFQSYKPASTNESYIPTRDMLRQQAKMMWDMINTDKNQYLIQDEIEVYFSGSAPGPMPSATPNSGYGNGGYNDPYNGGYGNGGYGSPYDNGQARQQAIQFFVQTDTNVDQKLTFSEYEDGYARNLLASSSAAPGPIPVPPVQPTPPPYGTPGR